ncbi:hypothetical protein KSD_27580 [Ktedonobacter sp. SOSP1-85]|uniref:DUF6612 family protein n=1 Tax=Ktedonobacter sp. SOSP1-85 TaxID=2778367 RepID=UPI0019169F40|nr:DUF6612 family protein [Ktedonobacter sp. SOSP1-85]GHO74987.1 hypothetical protein KSD_27580 [Ktedonobacter sp. SOSP1-85]
MSQKMQLWTRSGMALALVSMLMLLLSACSQSSTGTGTTSTTPLEVVQKSSTAMQQLKSSHFKLQLTDDVKVPQVSTGNGTTQPQNVSTNVNGEGDQAGTDNAKVQYTASAQGQSFPEQQVVKGNDVYFQVNGKWYVISKSDLQAEAGKLPLPSTVSLDQNSLLGLIQNSKITDYHTENVNGQQLRHLGAELDKEALRQLLKQNPQVASYFGVSQQNVDKVINGTKSVKTNLDVWIDESQYYVHRTQLKINLVADGKLFSDSATQDFTVNMNSILDLSKFNDPVTINAPANATRVTSLEQVLGVNLPKK